MKKYLTAKQVQETYQISEATFYKWLRLGLPHLKQGTLRRFSPYKINQWLRLHENKKK